MVITTATIVDRVPAVRTHGGCPDDDVPAVVRPMASAGPLGSSCDACRFRATCLGHAFRAAATSTEPLVGYRRALAQEQVLYRAGAKCSAVFVIQSGFFKTTMLSEDGTAQVTGFQMPGDLMGANGLSSGIHRSDAVALSHGSVCVVPRAPLLQASAENEALSRHLLGVLSDEIASDHSTMLLLGSRSAEERVAGFIVDLSERLAARGYSAHEIGLWMTREEIGSYLGLELETISRVLTGLSGRRLLDVHRRHLHVRDLDALRAAAVGDEARANASVHLRMEAKQ